MLFTKQDSSIFIDLTKRFNIQISHEALLNDRKIKTIVTYINISFKIERMLDLFEFKIVILGLIIKFRYNHF